MADQLEPEAAAPARQPVPEATPRRSAHPQSFRRFELSLHPEAQADLAEARRDESSAQPYAPLGMEEAGDGPSEVQPAMSHHDGSPEMGGRHRLARRRTGQRLRPPAGRGRVLVAASLTGALLFAGATGFGTHVTQVAPLGAQLDRLLAKSGFAINEVSVSGLTRTLESEVFRAIGPLDRSLVSLDVAGLRQRIEQLPTVETVVLTRILPDKLRIAVRERQPVAIWRDGERQYLVDKTGRVLGSAGSDHSSRYLVVSGPGGETAVGELLKALERHEGVRSRLSVAVRKGKRRWDLELSNGILVKLPAHDVEMGLRRLEATDRSLGNRPLRDRVLDFRLPDRVVVGALGDHVGLRQSPHSTTLPASSGSL